jgi:hypothetical protein
MVPFDYVGTDWRTKNRPRQLFAEALVAISAVVLFPFTLLVGLLWGLWYVLARRSAPR